MENSEIERRNTFSLDKVSSLFSKFVALVFIAFALLNWMKLIGMLDPDLRFDTMTVHHRIAVSFLAIVQPIAALGLWNFQSWGVVVWALAVLAEVIMFTAYSDSFRFSEATLMFHASCAGVFLLCYFAVNLRKSGEDTKRHAGN